MDTQRLYCKVCQAALTLPLRFDDEIHGFQIGQQDDSVIIPVGEAWFIDSPFVHGARPEDKAIWFSPHSLLDQVVTDPNALGCCGYEFHNNTRCKCGYIVGSRIDECGYQPRFEPNTKMTYWASAYHPELGTQFA